jgi:hypothetical protein
MFQVGGTMPTMFETKISKPKTCAHNMNYRFIIKIIYPLMSRITITIRKMKLHFA